MLFIKLDLFGYFLFYFNFLIGLNGEINYKFVFLCFWLFVLVWDFYLWFFLFLLGKRIGNKRIFELISKENFKVCD